MQAKIHNCLGKFAVLAQWYSLFSVGMLIFVIISTVEITVAYYMLEEMTVTENLHTAWEESKDLFTQPCGPNAQSRGVICNMTDFEDFKDYLSVPLWIKIMNGMSQVCGCVTICVVIYQLWTQFIWPSKKAAENNPVWKNHVWHTTKRVNWILWILIVPTVFSIETMRANTKVWGLVTGKSKELKRFKFAEAETLELLYAREDLEIAALIQFTAVYAFVRLISSMLERTSLIHQAGKIQISHFTAPAVRTNNQAGDEPSARSLATSETAPDPDELKKLATEFKKLTRVGGFLGLWVYIIAGCIRSLVTILIALALQLRVKYYDDAHDKWVLMLESVELSFESVTSSMFALLTILGVINMVVMSRTFIVTDRIGDANKKFLGARIMLLTSEIAPKVVDAFEDGTPLHEDLHFILKYFRFLSMKPEQAEMLKMAILNIACLVTVIFNLVFWKDVIIDELDKTGLLDFPTGTEEDQANAGDDSETGATQSTPFLGDDD